LSSCGALLRPIAAERVAPMSRALRARICFSGGGGVAGYSKRGTARYFRQIIVAGQSSAHS
ncbi:MAG: hypothetical protein M1358_09125, partial [Chloroflexi bacterium]|nr:hypothetical protein [Chloroflexota bacterium]